MNNQNTFLKRMSSTLDNSGIFKFGFNNNGTKMINVFNGGAKHATKECCF